MEQTIELPGTILTLWRKTVKGSLFGDCNPTTDIPKILGLYQSGDLKLDELITRTYTLEQVQEGYDDLLAGKNVRGIVVHDALVSQTEIRRVLPGPAGVVGRTRETELLRRGPRLRRARRARRPARHRQEHPAARRRRLTGVAVPLRRGQRRPDPRAADRSLRPGPGAGRGYEPDIYVDGPLIAALRAGGVALPRGAEPGPRGDAERAAHRHVGGRAERAAARARSGPNQGSGWSPP